MQSRRACHESESRKGTTPSLFPSDLRSKARTLAGSVSVLAVEPGGNVEADSPVALVTGAGQGLGRAACLALAEGGFRVVASDVSVSAAESTAGILRPTAGTWLECDVSSTSSVEAALARITQQFRRLDVVVNNAGIVEAARTEHVTDDQWNRIISLNQTGALRVARASYPLLCQSPRPSVINISSVVAQRGFPGRAAYAASKAALEALTRVLAVEWGPRGIRVNSVAPGFILTEGARKAYEAGYGDAEARAALTALGRLGEPKEIGEVVAWLASSGASYVTGTTITVDGGFLAFGRTGPDKVLEDDN